MAKGGGGKGRCMGCMEWFSGEQSFNMHRAGTYGKAIYQGNEIVGYTPHERHCLTVDQLLAKGMVKNERGVWTTGEKMPQAVIDQRSGQKHQEDEEGTDADE